MAAVGLRLVDAGTGGRPRAARVALRAALVYPGGFAATALGLVLYAAAQGGRYPSGAASDFDWNRVGLLAAIAASYVALVAPVPFRRDGRGLHDLAGGVEVLASANPALATRERRPLRLPRPGAPPAPLPLRWLVLAVPLGFLGLMLFALVPDALVTHDPGGLVVGLIMSSLCLVPATWLAVRCVPVFRWEYARFALDGPSREILPRRPAIRPSGGISRWWVLPAVGLVAWAVLCAAVTASWVTQGELGTAWISAVWCLAGAGPGAWLIFAAWRPPVTVRHPRSGRRPDR